MRKFELQLRDVLLYGRHGVLPEETTLGNQYRVNLRLRTSAEFFNPDEDNILSTISYADLYEIVESQMKIPSSLLETVAVRIQCEILERWPDIERGGIIEGGEIEIVKLAPPIPGMIGEAAVKYIF